MYIEVLSSVSHLPLINECEVTVLQAKDRRKKLRIWEVLLTTDERSTFTILLSSKSTGWRPATLIWTEEVLYTNPSSQSPLGAEQKKSVNKSCCQTNTICDYSDHEESRRAGKQGDVWSKTCCSFVWCRNHSSCWIQGRFLGHSSVSLNLILIHECHLITCSRFKNLTLLFISVFA